MADGGFWSLRPLVRVCIALLILACFILLVGAVHWLGRTSGPTAVKDLPGCSTEGQLRGQRCPREAGYYWCSTDRSDPVNVWNDGTAESPVWMVQHLSGQGDGYHQLKYSKCRFSPRLGNTFFPSSER